MLFLQEDWCAQALASQAESLQVRRKSRPAGPRDARTLALARSLLPSQCMPCTSGFDLIDSCLKLSRQKELHLIILIFINSDKKRHTEAEEEGNV